MTLVRTFDGRVLDMMELMVDAGSARVLEQFPSKNRVPVGTKPLISFSGAGFADEDPGSRFGVARSLLLDFFRGEEASDVHAEGLQMMITFTAVEEESVVDGVADKQMIHMRVWKVITRKSGQKVPRVELAEMGPRIDWRLGRLQAGDSSMMKEALKRGKSSTEVRPLFLGICWYLGGKKC